MYKREVSSTYNYNIDLVAIYSRPSLFGKEKPRLPYYHNFNTVVLRSKPIKPIKLGDILRSDGYPFMSRPKLSLQFKKEGYKTIKLGFNFYVLRKD